MSHPPDSEPAAPPADIPKALFATFVVAMLRPSLTLVALAPALPLVAAYFGGGVAGQHIAQMAQSTTFLGAATGGLVAGAVLGLRSLAGALAVAALAYAGGGLIAMTAGSSLMLFAGCLTIGVAGTVLSSGLAMATGAVLTGEPRSRMLGFQAALSDLSGILVGLVAGFVAETVGWRAPFAVYVCFGLLTCGLVARSRPAAPAVPASTLSGGLAAAVRLAWPAYVCAILFALPLGTLQLFLPFHLAAHGLTDAGLRGVVQTVSVAGAACASVSFGRLRARFGERPMLVAAGAAGALGFAAFGWWKGGFVLAFGPALASGIAIGISIPLLFVFILRLAPPALHAHAAGVLNTCIFLGTALSGVVFAPVARLAGEKGVFFCCSALVAISTVAISLRMRSASRPSPSMGEVARHPPPVREHGARMSFRGLEIASGLEATTLLALVFIAVPLKHIAGWPVAVKVMGPVHGIAFLIFVWTAIQTLAATPGQWSAGEKIRLFVGATLPFGGFANITFIATKERSQLAGRRRSA